MKQFLNTAEAAEQFGISPASARVLFHGVRDNIPERYRDLDIIGRKQVAIRAVALMDYSRYGDNLRTAPPYRPLEDEKELGIVAAPSINPHDLATEVARAVINMLGRITV